MSDSFESVFGMLLVDMTKMTGELTRLYVPSNNRTKDWELTEQEGRVVNNLRRLANLASPNYPGQFDRYEDEVTEFSATRTYLNFKADGRVSLGEELFRKHSAKISTIPDLKQAVLDTNLTEFAKLIGLDDKDDAAHLKIYLLRDKFGPLQSIVDPLNL